jgi:hypothetical protein
MRVIYTECSGAIWLRIAELAAERHGWTPVYWTAGEQDIAQIRSAFPDSVVQAGVDAARGVVAPEAVGWPQPAIDSDLLENLAAHESIALHMMDRMDPDGHSFIHDERRRHYYDVLRYWSGVLDRLSPDLIVFSMSPHIVYDYVLYALARHRGIATVMFDRIGLAGYVYATQEIGGLPVAALANDTRTLGSHFSEFLSRSSQGGAAAVPANFKKKLQRFAMKENATPGLPRGLWFEVLRAGYLLKRFGIGPVQNSYIKQPDHQPAQSRPNALQLASGRFRAQFSKWRLRGRLEKLALLPDVGVNYVLLALHYQPERAAVPLGGSLGDQTLIVDLLAKSIPQDWQLVVKEHPWQLQPFSRGETQRSDDFYERVTRYPNVRLLPANATVGDYLEKARAVATITGSVGWQALCLGVPALVFGAAWYRKCPGVFEVRSGADIRRAVVQIDGGFRASAKEIEQFLIEIEQSCVAGFLEPDLEDVSGLSAESVASGMADLLVKASEQR